MTIDHVAIVGAGFTGSLLAANLLRHDGPRATLIERRLDAGTGLAYGSAHPSHLLNVRAGNMSAFPDEPDHFIAWLKRRRPDLAGGVFVPRTIYGAYLRELLDEALASSRGRLEIVWGDVVDVHPPGRAGVVLADGRVCDADGAVLAVGNLAPHTPAGLDPGALGSCYKPDPWAPDATTGLTPGDTVVILGTGLTMVDLALKLEAEGFGGRIVAISRRGLLPRAHGHAPLASPPMRVRPTTCASALTRQVRDRVAAVGWRSAVDELRPFTQSMWRAASDAERTRFLRHLRPWWDVHRHRVAPAVADRLESMRASGRLAVIAGKPQRYTRDGSGVAIEWRPRGQIDPKVLTAARIINCTGPQGDLYRSDDPLLRLLTERGLVSPDSCRLGIDVTAQAATIGADGTASDRLFALGPMTRGAFWEIVAVPDIREQAWTLARRLSYAQWVGGEGL